jgi:chemotaxis protein MotB
MRYLKILPLIGGLALASTGCVKKGTHETVLSDLERTRTEYRALEREAAADNARLEERLAAEQRARREEENRLTSTIGRLEDELSAARRELATARDRIAEAGTEVGRLEALLQQRGSDYRQLEQRLQSLRDIEREVRQRNAIYEDVLGRFRSLIDAGRLTVAIDRGRMVIQLPQDILYPSGSATLSADGRRTIAEVGAVLADIDDRTFQVEGHTDNVPIATERFPSNWELSTARALSVVRVLVEQGVPPGNLSGAGYGEFQPVASNEERDARARNRRIEIVMLPNLDVIAAAQIPG